MTKLVGDAYLKTNINQDDYVMLHKSDIKLIKSDNDNFTTFSFWFDKVGMLFIGVVLEALITGDFSFKNYSFPLIGGITFVILGLYYSYKRNMNIKEAIDKIKYNP